MLCSGCDVDTNECKKVAGLFHRRANGIHDVAVRFGGVFSRDAAHSRPFPVQGSRFSEQRQRDYRASGGRGAVPARSPVGWSKMVAAAAVVLICLGISFMVFRINPLTKPGGLLLGGILCLALIHWLGQVMRRGNQKLLIRAFAFAGGLCLAYSASFVVVDQIVATNLPGNSTPAAVWIVALLVVAGFGGMFTLQAMLERGRGTARLDQWQIHAANGFYVENALRRVLGSVVRS